MGIFLLERVYATQSGMGAVFGSQIALSANQIALFVAMLFGGALLLQFPIGWLSDRFDRRKVIFGTAVMGALACGLGWLAGSGPDTLADLGPLAADGGGLSCGGHERRRSMRC